MDLQRAPPHPRPLRPALAFLPSRSPRTPSNALSQSPPLGQTLVKGELLVQQGLFRLWKRRWFALTNEAIVRYHDPEVRAPLPPHSRPHARAPSRPQALTHARSLTHSHTLAAIPFRVIVVSSIGGRLRR